MMYIRFARQRLNNAIKDFTKWRGKFGSTKICLVLGDLGPGTKGSGNQFEEGLMPSGLRLMELPLCEKTAVMITMSRKRCSPSIYR